ncbi:IclR family transcriptional regulator [Deinococcus deserti]|uniref:Putative transcriptional regulator, IclR family n=1 Tax=Deinococcus deserti (strain DSM 17065 / CIP 109153 / LMG 22923 / VCD115) TaxID=546414 RepID=C1D3J9_DEIDV|nr:IclR family transcriptional regulator [Deinococcus deserti]ACO48078.1 putative transcriptional regulator, IclR family [Deinococcus deserti VCD115]
MVEKDPAVGSIRSVERAFTLLDALARSDRPLTLTELSNRTDMSKATVLRFLATLEQWALTQKVNNGYQLNVGTLPLAYAFLMNDSLNRAALPVLQRVALATQETVTMYVRAGMERVVVQRVEGRTPFAHTLPVGQRLPLLLGAPGLVLAAAMKAADRYALLEHHPEVVLASGERFDRPAMEARLDQVHQQGYAISRSERLSQIFAVAAPVKTADQTVKAAVGITAHEKRITDEQVEVLIEEVMFASRAIGEASGSWSTGHQASSPQTEVTSARSTRRRPR